MGRPVVRTVSSGRLGAINDDASSLPVVTCEHGPVATVTNATDQRPARRLPPEGRVAGEAMVSFGRFEKAKTQSIHCSFRANGGWHLLTFLREPRFTIQDHTRLTESNQSDSQVDRDTTTIRSATTQVRKVRRQFSRSQLSNFELQPSLQSSQQFGQHPENEP